MPNNFDIIQQKYKKFIQNNPNYNCFTPFYNSGTREERALSCVPYNSFVRYQSAPKEKNPQKACPVNSVDCG